MPVAAGARTHSRRSSALSREVVDDLYDFALTVTWDPEGAAEAVRTGLRGVPPDADVAELFHRVRNEAVMLARPPEAATVDVNEELPAPADLPVAMIESIALPALDGLEPFDRAALDLARRRSFEGDELAAALGVPPQMADDMVQEAEARADRLLGHYVLARIGRDTCPMLMEALGDPPPGQLPPLAERVDAHMEECSLCTDRRLGLTPVTSMLDAIPPRPAPEELHDTVGHLWEKEEVEAEEAARQRRRWIGLAAVVGVVAAAGVAVGFGLFESDSTTAVEETATTLAAVLRPDRRTVDLGATDPGGSVEVRNISDRAVNYRVEVEVPWLTVSPGEGELPAGETAELALSLDRGAAPEGSLVTTIRILSSGTTTEVNVAAEVPKAPEILGVVPDPGQVSVAPCDQAPTTSLLRASVTSISSLAGVVAKTSQGDVPMQEAGGLWEATLGPYSAADPVTLTVVATDAIGKQGTSPEVTLQVAACPEPPRRGRR